MTIKQIQNLLQYLGYYEGIPDDKYGIITATATENFQRAYGSLEPDGKPGPLTQKALKDAVAYGMPVFKEEENEGNWWDEIEFFDREEFKCKCGGKYCNGYPAEMKREVVQIADAARRHFGRPGRVISGLRCDDWNAIQGGVYNSQHKYGEAIDLKIDGVKADDLLAFIVTQKPRYAYAINDTNVHFDIKKGAR